jgi:hypothetical protein
MTRAVRKLEASLSCVVVASLGLAAVATMSPMTATAAPDVSGGQARVASRYDKPKRDHKKQKVKPEKLWSLYPLNPRTGRSPASTQPSTPSPPPTSRYGADTGDEIAGETSSRPVASSTDASESWNPMPFALAAAAFGVAGLAWWFVFRRPRTANASAGVGQGRRVDPVPIPPKTSTKTDEALPLERKHVRVFLRDGRSIEGWRKDAMARDDRVLVLDVETVYDSGGHRVDSTPLDSFVLPTQIEHIERLEAAPSE